MSQPLHGIAGAMYRIARPVRDPLYTRFVKSFSCCACAGRWQVDPAHTGPHSHGKKGCDTRVIALCRTCHRAFDASPLQFAAKHNLDVEELIRTYRELYLVEFPERRPPASEGGEAIARREA
jgi:hypothetical protein